ncbi:lipoyl(octanoyl) transferase LipB [Pigmentiphaga sp. GD03639]|uniref:Octanoyltransferase n=1 Tax=Pigmentiphaga daeguensis TaxID=414049 RepID=A0ABN1BR33_9BURK|nr:MULTISPECIES: lipoyl(octanoyl) transferase LipB [unclassified Pigmentiphaga]MDH2235383.1 lipoyl(octanoyl) transferase LipB [Pigmentiphaga sp. GD03639]OVZ66295.1 octanoyltransferase [Pigmentiphaga sp. NML030171]
MLIRWLPSPADYHETWEAMKAFTAARGPETPDEIWLVEHPPVFTLGLAGKPEHVLAPRDVPVVKSDRGGQVTYHGPGQVVAYVLLDLKRAGYFVKEYVARVEQAVIDMLAGLGLPDARRKPDAPGVYVDWPRPPQAALELAKISALGIKVHRGCTYHGVALNVAMDLSPFTWINPCGYAGLRTVDLASCGCGIGLEEAGNRLARHLERTLTARAPAGALAAPAPAAVE